MGYQIIGSSLIGRADTWQYAYTAIDKMVPSPGRGIMKSASLYMVAGGNVKVKVFRDDGTHYIFIGETPVTTVGTGIVTIPAWIPVEKGDLIAYYGVTSPAYPYRDDSGGNAAYISGDITSTLAKTSWSATANIILSVQGFIFSRAGVL